MEVDRIIYKAKDGTLFNDPLECEDYEKSLGVLSGSIGELINKLEEEDRSKCYMFGIVLVKHEDGSSTIFTRYTVNLDDKLEDFVNVSNLTEEQRYDTATIGDLLKLLKKFDKDQMCQYMIVFSDNIDLNAPGIMANWNKEAWPKKEK